MERKLPQNLPKDRDISFEDFVIGLGMDAIDLEMPNDGVMLGKWRPVRGIHQQNWSWEAFVDPSYSGVCPHCGGAEYHKPPIDQMDFQIMCLNPSQPPTAKPLWHRYVGVDARGEVIRLGYPTNPVQRQFINVLICLTFGSYDRQNITIEQVAKIMSITDYEAQVILTSSPFLLDAIDWTNGCDIRISREKLEKYEQML